MNRDQRDAGWKSEEKRIKAMPLPENAFDSQRLRPNILLILADDMGFSDIGCYGSEIHTPNLDSLASKGLRFSHAYNCARCCPSRASLLTGLYPHQAGIGQMVRNLGPRAYQGYLRNDCATLGEMLRDAGYRTGLAGKWHIGGLWNRVPEARLTWQFGDPTRPLPTDRGFEQFFGNPAGGGSYFNIYPLVDQDRIIDTPEGFYTTNNYTDAALGMIDRAVDDGKPFFVHVCYNAPHWPLHALPEDIERYRGRYAEGWDTIRAQRHERLKGLGLLNPKWPISARDPSAPAWRDNPRKDWDDARMAVYAAQIDCMDRNIGRLLRRLEEHGILDDTLVIFVSDNGGSAEFLKEDGQKQREAPFTRDGLPMHIGNRPELDPGGPQTFMSYDLPWANASNSPFRLFKVYVHEGGISTPMIVHWPRTIRHPGIVHESCHFIDLAATILDVAGAKYPAELAGRKITPLEGESFAPLLRGERWTRSQPLFWEHEGHRAVRNGRWKLVRRFPGPWELYDMIEDRTELHDLSEKYPDVVGDLGRQYDEWARRCEVLPWEQVKEMRKS
jgi:arylsulfatase